MILLTKYCEIMYKLSICKFVCVFRNKVKGLWFVFFQKVVTLHSKYFRKKVYVDERNVGFKLIRYEKD